MISVRSGKSIVINDTEKLASNATQPLQKNTDILMYKLAELLPLSYQGVYATGNANPSKTAH